MICYVLAMGKQHLGPHVVVGYGIKIFWPGLFITSPDHLECSGETWLHDQVIETEELTMLHFCVKIMKSRKLRDTLLMACKGGKTFILVL